LRSADVLLRYLKYQPAGSHSEYVIVSLPKLIASELPSLAEYLDSRITQTNVHKRVSTYQCFNPVEDRNYMLESSHLSPDFNDFQKKFAHKRTKILCGRIVPLDKKELLEEREVKVEVLDLPFVHSYNGEGFKHANAMF